MGKRKHKLTKIKIAATAVVDKSASIGRGTTIWNFTQIMHMVTLSESLDRESES